MRLVNPGGQSPPYLAATGEEMKKLALFNHKGGVGKTTLTVNLADAIADTGKTVLLVDADPQCNLSSFYLEEKDLDRLLGESDESESTGTLWAAVKPVVKGRGGVTDIEAIEITERISLAVGDVLLSDYEEELPAAWTESFARKTRGYDVISALPQVVQHLADEIEADIVMYDVGPNVGPLNRTVLLDCDYFITPVHTDLYSLRALTTVGRALARWVTDWATVRTLASKREQSRLMRGKPKYIGYVSSAYKVYGGHKAMPHEYWERMLAPRVKSRMVDVLREVDEKCVVAPPYKIGDVQHFHSLAAEAQKYGRAVAKLRGYVRSGHDPKIDEIGRQFKQLAREVLKRMEVDG